MSEAVGGEDTSDNRTVSHSDEPADSRAKSNAAAQGQKETNSKEQKSTDGNTPPTKSISTSVQYQSVEDLFEGLGMSAHVQKFIEEDISMADLMSLDSKDLTELLPRMGPRRRLERWLGEAKGPTASAIASDLQ